MPISARASRSLIVSATRFVKPIRRPDIPRAADAACVAAVAPTGVDSVFASLREELRAHAGSYLLLIALFASVGLTPLPYVRSAPGSTYDALGEINGTSLVSIEDSSQYPTDETTGQLRILTVSQWGGPYGTLSWFDAARSLWDQAIYIIPTKFLFPPDADPSAVRDESQIQFASAQSSAIGASFKYLDIPVREFTSIVYVDDASPNAKLLKVGDQLVSADGEPIATIAEFSQVMSTKVVGDTVSVVLKRGDETKKVELTTYARPQETKVRIGVVLLTDFDPPMKLTFGLSEVGGPSAGLAFALAIVDKLNAVDLMRDRSVAVTGEIDSEGNVGAIGGLPQKMASAVRDGSRLMLFPRENCPINPDLVPAELTLVPVRTLAEAVDVLSSKDSSTYPQC